MDRYLDTTRVGPISRRRPEVAAIVVQALQRGRPSSTTTCGRFWQRESYDHVVKQEREMERLVACIENNPVKAGLVVERLERRS